VRIRVAGDLSTVSTKVREALQDAERSTVHNTRLTLTVAFNYGGRWDIVQACRRAIEAGLNPDQLDEAALSRFMTMSYAPDPDLFIRTGGEVRLSNFLLWQPTACGLILMASSWTWPSPATPNASAALATWACRAKARAPWASTWSRRRTTVMRARLARKAEPCCANASSPP